MGMSFAESKAVDMSEPRELLANDHEAVGEVLRQLLTALNNNDVRESHAKLDLLWARLAVHIRAEHLHLFPAVAARVSEAETVIENLRADHDFFMRELAHAINILRAETLASVLDTVRKVENRLTSHNEIEEKQVYDWAGSVLTDSEQTTLAARINAELEKRPPRFSLETWANRLSDHD
jgi:hemerythrin-like domain-containing protein